MSAGSIGIPGRLTRERSFQQARRPFPVVEGFILFEFACQVALTVSSIGGLRVLVRCGAFGVSLLLVLLFTPGKRLHPSVKPAMVVMGILAFAFLNPHTNTLLSATMQILLYAAIMAPLLWVSNLPLEKPEIRRILLIMLAFQALSSLIGVLQVYYPGRFRGNISTVISNAKGHYIKGLYYKNAAGGLVLRPSGLTDIPGGVGMAGQYATLFSVYFFLTDRDQRIRWISIATALIGVAAVSLSGVKSAMICLGISLATFTALFFWQGLRMRGRRVAQWAARQRISPLQVLVLVAVVAVGGYYLAIRVGGQGVTNATGALTQSAPGQVFYEERGRFLEYTINVLLPQYPFGAGLGRWGMMSYYFGNQYNPNSMPIWVEIQWTGWLVDGGVPLVLAYAFAIFAAIRFAVKCSQSSALGDFAVLGALVAGYDVSVVAGTFDYNPFITSMGMDFWLLNAILFGVIAYSYRDNNRRVSTVNDAIPARYR